jgi:opacity protein-like surface antigen
MYKLKLFLLSVATLLSFAASAQLGGTHDYSDTAYIAPAKRADLVKDKSNFPGKPRDMWQLGVFMGYPYVTGDCPSGVRGTGNSINNYAYGFGVSARKSVGYVISFRLSLAYYNMVGLDYKNNGNVNNSPVILATYTNPRRYVHNYNTKAIVPSLDVLLSFNNIMFHTKQQRWNFYGMLGIAPLLYDTKMDVLDANGNKYNFDQVTMQYQNKRDIRKGLRGMMDGKYETPASDEIQSSKLWGWNIRNCFTFGAGIEYRMGKNWSLSAEYKRIQTRDDNVDGWFRQSGDLQYPVYTSEHDNIGFVSLGINFNVGNSKQKTAPLWWLNPLEFAYKDLADNKEKIKKGFAIKDEDGDGVINELDLEPNTPEGSPVDTHGRALDTDGDGIPDYKDKEKLTQQKCFPVDADGVGNCPDPACCAAIEQKLKNIKTGGGIEENTCGIAALPSIIFKEKSYRLSKEAKILLGGIAQQMKNNPTCKVKVTGFVADKTKPAQQSSWEKVNAVVKYLVEKEGISEKRLVFIFGEVGDPNAVDLVGTSEGVTGAVPAPHPNLRKSN